MKELEFFWIRGGGLWSSGGGPRSGSYEIRCFCAPVGKLG